MFWTIARRDLRLALGREGVALPALAFLAITATLFAFSLGPEALRTYAAQVLWVTALFASLLALPHLFEKDYQDGGLEQLLLLPVAHELTVLAKMLAHWAAVTLPLLAALPALGIMAGSDIGNAMLSVLLGTPALVAVGALGSALTLGLRQNAFLKPLLLLPLYVPMLIFAAAAAKEGGAALLMLLALSLIAVPLACWLTGWLLRTAYE